MDLKYEQMLTVSNPVNVLRNLKKYLKVPVDLRVSTHKYKKYQILNPNTHQWVHFGDIRYEDYTYHQDNNRRRRYLQRSTHIRGDWASDPYSSNLLAINGLWA